MQKETLFYNGMPYRLYKPIVPSDNYFVFLHGSGEWGLPDGSLINKVWTHGYPKLAEAGYEFPFNLLCPQAFKGDGSADFALIKKNIVALLRSYNARYKVIGGLSQGGEISGGFLVASVNGDMTTCNYIDNDYFDGYIIICGRAPYIPQWCANPDKPVIMVHGTADASVKIWDARKLRDNCNACVDRALPVELLEIEGGTHSDAWIKGLDPNNEDYGAKVYAFVNNILVTSSSVPFDSIVLENDKIIATFGNRKFQLTATEL